MITLELDPTDVRTLRISASYLLALAGDITTEISGADKPVRVEVTERVGDISHTVTKTYADGTVATGVHPLPEASPTFNDAEVAEAEAMGQPHFTAHNTLDTPDAAEIFGAGKSTSVEPPPHSAPSTVDVEIPTIAPVVTTDTAVPSVPSPPVQKLAVGESHAVQTSTNHVELDARGLPWDARIHSRERTKIAIGNWKNKRGVDATILAAVEAELKDIMFVPVADVSPPPASSIPAPPPTTIASGANPSSLPEMMKRVTALINEKRITAIQVRDIAVANGIPSLNLLATRPDLIPQINRDIDALIGGA